MAADAPTLYLDKVVSLLTGSRAMGPASRVREGYRPFSRELDFPTTNLARASTVVLWAREQAPYATIELVHGSGSAGPITIFAEVDLPKLARFLAEHALMQATGQTWETASGALPAFVRQTIDTTVGAGGTWQSLIDRLRSEYGHLITCLQMIETGQPGPVAAIVWEAAQDTVGQEASWRAFIHRLRSQADVLDLIARAIETGDYLLGSGR